MNPTHPSNPLNPSRASDSHFSLTIALNARSQYEGGGLYLEEADRVLRPDTGHVVCFPGSVRHGGHTVSR